MFPKIQGHKKGPKYYINYYIREVVPDRCSKVSIYIRLKPNSIKKCVSFDLTVLFQFIHFTSFISKHVQDVYKYIEYMGTLMSVSEMTPTKNVYLNLT